jgi:GNAT superfamily N-acetyltransferase
LPLAAATAADRHTIAAGLSDIADRRQLFAVTRDDAGAVAAWLAPAPGVEHFAWHVAGRPVGLLRCEAGDLSYFVVADARRQGVAHAMLAAWIAMTTAPALTASVQRENIVSRRLLEAAGFGFTGLVHNADGVVLLGYQRQGATRTALSLPPPPS